ncbi:MAG: class E sortase [Firmicutes bacterium]|nr:class E sortase [Bacillota bacterium]
MFTLYPLFNHFYSSYQQDKLQAAFKDATPDTAAPAGEPAAPAQPPAPREFKEALLEAPSIKLSRVVRKGTSTEVLAEGPGWYEESVLPGEGNTAIAGHLNTDGSPFRRVPQLKPGDSVKLTFEDRTYEYRVERVFTIDSTDWSVIGPCGYSALTLTTCIAGDSKHRLVVRAAEVK